MAKYPKQGNLVRLKSGGPKMTVVKEEYVSLTTVSWFPHESTIPQVAQFHTDMLDFVEKEKESTNENV